MAKILYSAKAPDGKPATGFIQAESNEEALKLLSEKGYADIRFYLESQFQNKDAFSETEKMRHKEVSFLSRFIIENQTRGSLFHSIAWWMKIAELPLMIGIILFVLGYMMEKPGLELAGIVAVPVIFVYLYFVLSKPLKVNDQFSKTAYLIAHGKFAEAEKLVDRILTNRLSKMPGNLATELISKKAYLIARQQTLEKGLAYLESMKIGLKDVPEWRMEVIYATTFTAVGDFASFLQHLHTAHSKAPDNQTISLDLAAAEARWGNIDSAKQLLQSVNPATLAQFALPYLDYVKGLVAKSSQDPAALELFRRAYEKQLEFIKNVHTLQVLAMMSAHYGLALLDAGEKAQAEEVILQNWDVLKNSTDKALLQVLKTKLPVLNQTGSEQEN